jgi:hypothetical protein
MSEIPAGKEYQHPGLLAAPSFCVLSGFLYYYSFLFQ